MAYKLNLSPTSKLHPVFHISQLRCAVGLIPASPTIPLQLNSELELVVEPEQLLQVRRLGSDKTGRLKVLIKWKQLPAFEATWEDFHMISERFPGFHLEDKVLNLAGSNVIHGNGGPEITHVFTRRKKQGNKSKGNMDILQA